MLKVSCASCLGLYGLTLAKALMLQTAAGPAQRSS